VVASELRHSIPRLQLPTCLTVRRDGTWLHAHLRTCARGTALLRRRAAFTLPSRAPSHAAHTTRHLHQRGRRWRQTFWATGGVWRGVELIIKMTSSGQYSYRRHMRLRWKNSLKFFHVFAIGQATGCDRARCLNGRHAAGVWLQAGHTASPADSVS